MHAEDTTPDIHRRQMVAYQRMGPQGRAELGLALSQAVYDGAISGIRHRHPEYTPEEVIRAYVHMVHGAHLALATWPGKRLLAP